MISDCATGVYLAQFFLAPAARQSGPQKDLLLKRFPLTTALMSDFMHLGRCRVLVHHDIIYG